MLFEILSTIELTASAALVIAVLALALATTGQRRIGIAAALTAWFAIVVVLGATPALDARVGVGVPGLAAAVVVPFAALCAAILASGPIRAALSAIPLPALVAAHGARVLGVSFLVLYAAHRLPAPFAPLAGWGDIIVGLAAPLVAWAVARNGVRARTLLLAWNAIGLADLALAIALGATSSPGPIQIFTGPPDSALMTTLPWILIPCFLVPSYLALHVAIFYRLSRASPASTASGEGTASMSRGRGPLSAGGAALRVLLRTLEHMSA